MGALRRSCMEPVDYYIIYYEAGLIYNDYKITMYNTLINMNI